MKVFLWSVQCTSNVDRDESFLLINRFPFFSFVFLFFCFFFFYTKYLEIKSVNLVQTDIKWRYIGNYTGGFLLFLSVSTLISTSALCPINMVKLFGTQREFGVEKSSLNYKKNIFQQNTRLKQYFRPFNLLVPQHFQISWLSSLLIMSVPDRGYSRTCHCTLNSISTFLLLIKIR